jgi:hypothetical protein
MTNPQDLKTLGEALPEEMARVHNLLTECKKPIRGIDNSFEITCMACDLQHAEDTLMSGDEIKMAVAYEALKGWKE